MRSVVVGSVMDHGFPFALTTESQILPSVSRRSGAWIGHLSRILTVSYLCTCVRVCLIRSAEVQLYCATRAQHLFCYLKKRESELKYKSAHLFICSRL